MHLRAISINPCHNLTYLQGAPIALHCFTRPPFLPHKDQSIGCCALSYVIIIGLFNMGMRHSSASNDFVFASPKLMPPTPSCMTATTHLVLP